MLPIEEYQNKPIFNKTNNILQPIIPLFPLDCLPAQPMVSDFPNAGNDQVFQN
jgi:hypothetical protein